LPVLGKLREAAPRNHEGGPCDENHSCSGSDAVSGGAIVPDERLLAQTLLQPGQLQGPTERPARPVPFGDVLDHREQLGAVALAPPCGIPAQKLAVVAHAGRRSMSRNPSRVLPAATTRAIACTAAASSARPVAVSS